jgi:hypothetical protein
MRNRVDVLAAPLRGVVDFVTGNKTQGIAHQFDDVIPGEYLIVSDEAVVPRYT